MKPVDPTTPAGVAIDVEGLRLDGPTVEQYVAAGYKAENYPPCGYAPRTELFMKYYHAIGVNRNINSDGQSFTFHPYEHTGLWAGVLATDKPEEIAALDKAVLDKKSGVIEIDKDYYEAKLKKKAEASNGYQQSLASSTPMPGALPTAPSAEPVNALPDIVPPTPAPAPLANVAAALEVGRVEKAG